MTCKVAGVFATEAGSNGGIINVMYNLITKIEVLEPPRLRVTFNTGEVMDVNLQPLVDKGGVFIRLTDAEYLRSCKIMEGGHFLAWPDDLDIAADSLKRRGVLIQTLASPVSQPTSNGLFGWAVILLRKLRQSDDSAAATSSRERVHSVKPSQGSELQKPGGPQARA